MSSAPTEHPDAAAPVPQNPAQSGPGPWLPPEWHPQAAILLTWPHPGTDWASILADAEKTFLALAVQISRRQNLLIACDNDACCRTLNDRLADAGVDMQRTHLYCAPSDDSWARDHGPITVLEGAEPILLDFQFNGWGEKYAHALDNRITSTLYRHGAFGQTRIREIDRVLEGGAIDVNGLGELLTTESCLLNRNRNRGLRREQAEDLLREQLGVTTIYWLAHGKLAGDDTDGHIDTLARFTDPDTICYVQCLDTDDEHYQSLQAMEAELQALRRPDGSAFKLVPLPLPRARFGENGERLPATYANFLIMNQAVLVPIYQVEQDQQALARLAELFPDREICAIDCVSLIEQHGSLHCVTMQIPAEVAGSRVCGDSAAACESSGTKPV